MPGIAAVGLDAGDTLWHNEALFAAAQARFAALMADHADPAHLAGRLLAAERRNLPVYGYGVKGFTLSMIETAIAVSGGRVAAAVIGALIDAGRAMPDHPVTLLPGVREAVEALAARHRLVLITKGDLAHQQAKVARSGPGDLFRAVEIVADKTPPVYGAIFARHGEGADRALMAGNSLRADVLPVLAAGGWGVHIPHPLTWAVEAAEPPHGHPRFRELPDLGALSALVAALSEG